MTPLALVRLFREKYSESLFFDFQNEKEEKKIIIELEKN